MDDDHASCNSNIGLGLGLSIGGYFPSRQTHDKKPAVGLDLSFTLRPKDEAVSLEYKPDRPRSSPRTSDEDDETEVMNKRNHDHLNGMSNDNILRKKLRLTKEQSSLLEKSFKLHSTLNPAQKQTLAEQLNLKPRQVEVWFQNRRARTKLKQTEVDCEFLKKCCERLSDENRRLKKELQELRSPPEALYIQLPKAATLAVCPSCAGGGRPGERTSCGGSASEDQ